MIRVIVGVNSVFGKCFLGVILFNFDRKFIVKFCYYLRFTENEIEV